MANQSLSRISSQLEADANVSVEAVEHERREVVERSAFHPCASSLFTISDPTNGIDNIYVAKRIKTHLRVAKSP